MLPVLQGLIGRRVLLNFRADPEAVQKLLPKPFQVETFQGYALVGICLIRLEQIRPRGFPRWLGMASENMAHRVAVRYPSNGAMSSGVLVWRRETDQKLVQKFGGRLFPGVHHAARFVVHENEDGITMDVQSADGNSDVSFSAKYSHKWRSGSVFPTLDEASEFFRHGDCGFSCSLQGDSVEGMQLRIFTWSPMVLEVGLSKCSFYSDTLRFPPGSVEFDCGLMLRAVPHEWHGIADVPRLETGAARPHASIASLFGNTPGHI
jgi:hypothetical protein